jgi:3-methyladenine DNA glycosylase AlkD
MIEQKLHEIREFFVEQANPEIVKKYARYFKDGFDGYGIDQKTFEKQRDIWIEKWSIEMSQDDFLNLGDKLMQTGKYEEKSMAIALINSQRKFYTPDTFERIGKWFDLGISNWAISDVLCMLVLPHFILDDIISFDTLKTWTKAESEWQRRSVPVTLVELLKNDLNTETAFNLVEPLMLDKSEYVQKGIGTLLRGLWKKYPSDVEHFLMKWKDQCGRLIVQYAIEKMDKEYRKKFRRKK